MWSGEKDKDMRVNNCWLLNWSIFKVLEKIFYSTVKMTRQSLQGLVKFVISREIVRE